MAQDDIVHIEQLLNSIVHRKKNVTGEEWLKIQWLRFDKTTLFKKIFKYMCTLWNKNSLFNVKI